MNEPIPFSRYAEELGVYVGPAETAEVIKALAAHTPGEWVMQLTDPDGRQVWHKSEAWSWEIVEDDERVVFTVARSEQDAGNPVVFVDAPLVLVFLKDSPLSAECSLYSGGLVFRPGFGDYDGYTLTLVAWHGVWHETESGDVAPGLGPFTVTDIERRVEEADED
jgi:hypothetical protein